jgi:hypothetical protein
MTQWRGRQIAAASSLGVLVSALDFSNGSIEFKAVAFGATFLFYTFVKFNQEKTEVGTRATQRGVKPLASRRQVASPALQDLSISLLQDGLGSACAQRLLASSTRAAFARACLPKTVSSTRRQYASMTFAFSADSPLVTCISGPNPESVAVRLTIM